MYSALPFEILEKLQALFAVIKNRFGKCDYVHVQAIDTIKHN